jgi:hypothetical protein
VVGERGPSHLEDRARLGDAGGALEAARPQAPDQRGEVPGVDGLAVRRGLAADGLEAGAVRQRRRQRVAGARLVEPGERGRRRRVAGLRGRGAEEAVERTGHLLAPAFPAACMRNLR